MALRFGLVGTGYWARETHATALARHPGTDLVGVWGRSPERAAALAGDFGAQAFDDADAMFAEVDAVAFAVPPDIQAELAVRAAAAGCHLLLDKPVAFTTAAADAVVGAVAAAGVRSLVFFTRRFTPNQADWLAGLQQRQDWFAGYVRMYGSIFEPGNPYSGSQWRRERGGLWDVGPHALSTLVPVLGAVERVVAESGPDDLVTVVSHHSSGASSTMTLSLTAPLGSRGGDVTFFGQEARADLPEPTIESVEAFGVAISALLADQPGHWEHPCDVRFGRDVVRVLESAQTFLDRPTSERAEPVA